MCILFFFAGSSVNQPNLSDLLTELVTVAPDWYNLGLELDLDWEKLNIIKSDSSQNCKESLCKMLQEWLNNSDDTKWNAVADALESDLISKKNLARKIRCKYLSEAHT